MMLALLIAGIGLLLAGLLTVVLGILIDLSFGNTLITSGAITASTGIILLGLWVVVRELKNIARLLGAGAPTSRSRTASQPAGAPRDLAAEKDELLFDRPGAENAGQAEPAPPWQQEAAARDRGRQDAVPEPVAPEPVKPRRNLLFSSSSRKERERAQARTAEASPIDVRKAIPWPRHRRHPSRMRRRRRPSTMRGRNRNARGGRMCRRSGAVPARHRPLPRQIPAWSRPIPFRRLHERREVRNNRR